jgi:hypothetical protein
VIVLVINFGYLSRNWLVFGSLLGGEAQAQTFTNTIMNLRVLLSNLLRNASLHAGTPWPSVNEGLYTLLAKVHWKLDLGMDDARTSMHPFFTIWDYPPSETHATNTVQAVIILLAVVLVMIRWKRFRSDVILFGGMGILGFILFSSIFKFDILGSRYHMPFFVLAAPFVAAVFAQTVRPIFLGVLILGLLVGASPILLSLENRPLIPTDAHGSIFSTRRLDQYFFESPNLDEPYILITEEIEAAGCNQVGLILKGDTAEYLLWVLLDAPRKELTVDWIISTSDVSGTYRLDGFQPCAVICEGCGSEGDRYYELPLVFDNYGYRLYLSGNP